MYAFKRNLNGNYFKKGITDFLACSIILNALLPSAFALEAGNIISSSGIIGDPAWGDHTIIDTQNGAIIDWKNFNTSSTQSVTFRQYDGANLSSFSAVLNRISSGTAPTQFNGALNANGRVFIVNPAGVIFGAGSTVNVAQLVASGLNMTNGIFSTVIADENNRMSFKGGGGDVINNGDINAEQSVYLVGENVINNGIIHCPGGLVVMAAGDKLFLGQRAGNVIVNVDSDLISGSNNSIINNGRIGEDSSPIAKLVLAAGDIFSQTVADVTNVAAVVKDNIKLNSVIAAGVVKSYSSKQAGKSSSPTINKEIKLYKNTKNAQLTTGKPKQSCEKPEPKPSGDPDTGSSDPISPPDPTDPPDPSGPADPPDTGQEPDSQLKSLQRQWQIDAKNNSQIKGNPGKTITTPSALLAAAPIPDEPELEISGCPALTKWAAKELGIDGGATQITFAGSPASAAGIPPCDACARLRQSAAILRDYTGVHIAALASVINEFASNDAPLSEEQDAAITATIAGGAGGNTEYALAKEYLDALADYVAMLNNDMNLATADSMELVLNKYIEPLIEKENVGLATFLAAKLLNSPGS